MSERVKLLLRKEISDVNPFVLCRVLTGRIRQLTGQNRARGFGEAITTALSEFVEGKLKVVPAEAILTPAGDLPGEPAAVQCEEGRPLQIRLDTLPLEVNTDWESGGFVSLPGGSSGGS